MSINTKLEEIVFNAERAASLAMTIEDAIDSGISSGEIYAGAMAILAGMLTEQAKKAKELLQEVQPQQVA